MMRCIICIYEMGNSKRTLHGALLDAESLQGVSGDDGRTNVDVCDGRKLTAAGGGDHSTNRSRTRPVTGRLPLRKSWLRMNRGLIWCCPEKGRKLPLAGIYSF